MKILPLLILAALGGSLSCSSQSSGGKPIAHKGMESKGQEPGSPGDPLWTDLVAGNTRFIEGKAAVRDLIYTRQELASGQRPKIMVLTCADSRLSPEIIFDKNLGELFVVRVAGNVADPVAAGSLEYAEEHLHCKLLIVLGHESCGAVAAAASGEAMPTPNLQAIVTRINPALMHVEPSSDPSEFALRQVIANVQESTDDLLRLSPLLKHAENEHTITVVRAVYHLKSGVVERLPDPHTASAAAHQHRRAPRIVVF